MNKIIRIFSDVDLRNGHDGLNSLAAEKKIKLNDLADGEFVFFLNAKKDKIRIFCSRDAFISWRSPSGKIRMEMLKELPLAFNGREFDFRGAMRKSLEKSLGLKPVGLAPVTVKA